MEIADEKNHELVVGLEVHIQLNTESKAFNQDLNKFGSQPNTNVSAITLAHPGTLPKANSAHIEKALKLAFATNSRINKRNQFDRKNYFYPDLPKGYQITQDKYPICVGGRINFVSGGKSKTIRLHHIHMEEDAGKSSHELSSRFSLLDYNRAGTPLVEMVTEPDFRSSDEVHDFMAAVQSMVKYLGVSDGNMEEGSMRCDCNVSIRPKGAIEYGERCEIKNVNSKKFARQAVESEFRRQLRMINNGEVIVKQTLNFNPETGITAPLRSKEDAHDYRYFPDPDLPPIVMSDEYLQSVKDSMPLLAEQYETILKEKYGLSEYDAGVLTQEKSYVDYFLKLAEKYTNYKQLSNLVINKVVPTANERSSEFSVDFISDQRLVDFLSVIDAGKVSPSAAYQLLYPEMIKFPTEDILVLAKKVNILKSEDQSFVQDLIDELLEAHPVELEKYRVGNKQLLGFFMGQAMRKSGGKADPKVLKTQLLQKLNG